MLSEHFPLILHVFRWLDRLRPRHWDEDLTDLDQRPAVDASLKLQVQTGEKEGTLIKRIVESARDRVVLEKIDKFLIPMLGRLNMEHLKVNLPAYLPCISTLYLPTYLPIYPPVWQRANAQNNRLYYPYWQYNNLFILWFVSLLCLRSTLRLFYLPTYLPTYLPMYQYII